MSDYSWQWSEMTSEKENMIKLLKKLKARLKEAEDVIEFYSSHENWSRRDTIFWESIDRNDCANYPHVTRDLKLTGGKRAREYMNKYRSNNE